MTGPDNKPLLVLNRAGEGRVALLLSDQGWLWSRGYEGGGPHVALFRRLAHWLMKEPELEEEALDAEGTGSDLVITRHTIGGDPGPATVVTPTGQALQVTLADGGNGEWQGRLQANELGLYQVANGDLRALANIGPVNPREYREAISTTAKLQPIAAETRGDVRRLAGETGGISVPRIVPMAGGPKPRDATGSAFAPRTRRCCAGSIARRCLPASWDWRFCSWRSPPPGIVRDARTFLDFAIAKSRSPRSHRVDRSGGLPHDVSLSRPSRWWSPWCLHLGRPRSPVGRRSISDGGDQRHQRRRIERRRARHRARRRAGGRAAQAGGAVAGSLAPLALGRGRNRLPFFPFSRSMVHETIERMKLFGQLVSPYSLGLPSDNALRSVVDAVIDFPLLQSERVVPTFVSATDVETGNVRVFSGRELTADALLASACLPDIFVRSRSTAGPIGTAAMSATRC